VPAVFVVFERLRGRRREVVVAPSGRYTPATVGGYEPGVGHASREETTV
jgi:hypothetical protein